MVILLGFCGGTLLHVSPHHYWGVLTVFSFSADGDEVVDRLPKGFTDEAVDLWMERSFPRYCIYGNFHTGILVCIFTVSVSDGRMGFMVRKADGKIFNFIESMSELHYLDTAQSQDDGFIFAINTVQDNKVNFAKKDYSRPYGQRTCRSSWDD